MLWTVLLLVVGFVLLVVGAELLVRGAAGLSLLAGLSPLVIGLTVVAYGTSAPEFAVNIGAIVSGRGNIALGNVLGSNTFNLLVILGLTAVAAPLVIQRGLFRRDIPVMVAACAALMLMSIDGQIGRLDSLLLVGGLMGHTIAALVSGRRWQRDKSPPDQVPDIRRSGFTALAVQIGLVLGGLGLLVLGARWVVASSVDIARAAGLSELVIGLTLVAAGTSLPELATSVTAALRGRRDIAVGNLVGSSICNVLAVLGISGLISPIQVSTGILSLDMPVMLAAAVFCVPLLLSGFILTRKEGLILVCCYVAYVVYLLLDSYYPGIATMYGPLALLVASVVLTSVAGLAVYRACGNRLRLCMPLSGEDRT